MRVVMLHESRRLSAWLIFDVGQASHVNESIRLHDATISAVSADNGRCIIEMSDVVVYKSVGVPGVDAGECALQDFCIIIESAAVTSTLPEMPCELDGGDLRVGGLRFSEFVPSTFKEEKSTSLRFWVAWHKSALEVTGRSVAIVPTGEPRHSQVFSPRK